MLRFLVAAAIRWRGLVATGAVVLIVYGGWRLSTAGLDIFPEFSPKAVVVQTEAPGMTTEQVERLVTAPPHDAPLGRRDRAILELFYASGLRLSELAGLDVDDVNLSGQMVRALGKGGKEQIGRAHV